MKFPGNGRNGFAVADQPQRKINLIPLQEFRPSAFETAPFCVLDGGANAFLSGTVFKLVQGGRETFKREVFSVAARLFHPIILRLSFATRKPLTSAPPVFRLKTYPFPDVAARSGYGFLVVLD